MTLESLPSPGGEVRGVSERPVSGDSAILDEQNPWPGLAAYDEASADYFHGRSEEAAELLRLIRSTPLTVLYAKSGLGKSSLLQAGLFQRLRTEHYLPIYVRLDFADGAKDSPLEQVARRIAEELDASKTEYPARSDGESLWEYLHRRDLELWSKDNFPLIPVLVFDQFEELFSRSGNDAALISEVFDNLADLIENRIPTELTTNAARSRKSRLDLRSQRYRIVLSFREDFLPEMRTWERRAPSLLRNYLRLEPMSRQRAIDAVKQAGASVLSEGVAERIVDFVGQLDESANGTDASTSVIEPVLLSLCCYQLNHRRPPGTKIDAALVAHAGQDILDNFYREALNDDEVKGPPDASAFIEEYLVQGDHFRGDYPKQEALDNKLLTKKQLDALTDRHHLLRVIQHADTARIELIHDRLIPVVRKVRDERRIKTHQDEQDRQTKAAKDELEKERALTEQLQAERDSANRSAKLAKRSFYVALATSVLCASLFFYAQWEEQRAVQARVQAEEAEQRTFRAKQEAIEAEQEAVRAQQEFHQKAEFMRVARNASFLPEGRLALRRASGTLEQTIYRGLATYRLAIQGADLWRTGEVASQARPNGLIALHSVMDATGHLRKVLRINGLEPTTALGFSPDGTILAVGGEDGKVHLLDAETYESRGLLDCDQHSEDVWSIAFNHDGRRLAAGFIGETDAVGSGLVCVFDVVNHQVLRRWDANDLGTPSADIYSVAYGGESEKEIVVSSGSDNMVRVWDVKTGKSLKEFSDTLSFGVAVSADGRKLAFGGDDAILRVRDLADERSPSIELRGHQAPIEMVAFSPVDDSVIVSAGDDGFIMVWDGKKHCLAQKSDALPTKIYGIAVSSDGKMVAAAGLDGNVRLFWLNMSSCGKQKKSAKSDAPQPLSPVYEGVMSADKSVWAVAINSAGDRLASTGADEYIRIWGPSTDSFSLASLQSKDTNGQAATLPAAVNTVAISLDSKLIAAGDATGKIYIWDRPGEGAEPAMQPAALAWTAHEKSLRALAFVWNEGRQILVSGGDDGVLKRWDPANGTSIGGDMTDNAKPILSVAVSPDERVLAAGSSDGTVRFWNSSTGEQQYRIDGHTTDVHELNAIGFSSDGKYLAIGSNGDSGLHVVSLDSKEVKRVLNGHTEFVKSIATLPTASGWILSAAEDGSLLEWPKEAMSGPQSKALRLPDEFEFRMKSSGGQPLIAMNATPDGSLILTGGLKGQVQLWDGKERVLIGMRFPGHTEDIRAVAVAPDGSFFVTADAGKILLWPGPDRWDDLICGKLSRNMSQREWREWISPDIGYALQCPNLPVPQDEP